MSAPVVNMSSNVEVKTDCSRCCPRKVNIRCCCCCREVEEASECACKVEKASLPKIAEANQK